MDFKDYYAALGIARTATQTEVKRAYRKLARKYHPDVSKEPQAEARFKDVAEAHEALIDPERRADYDLLAQRHTSGQGFEGSPGWRSGPADGHSDGGAPDRAAGRRRGRPDLPGAGADFGTFFESMFARGAPRDLQGHGPDVTPAQGEDVHATVVIGLLDAYQGARRMVTLQLPGFDSAVGAAQHERQLEVSIPKGVREGQQLRLAGQGASGWGDAPAGDLYLELQFQVHPVFRVDGGDLSFDLPVAPWEAALGATVTAPTLDGNVALAVPAGSFQGRRLRLKGKGLPGKRAGDLYAVLAIVLPPSASESEQAAYAAFAGCFATWNPRAALNA